MKQKNKQISNIQHSNLFRNYITLALLVFITLAFLAHKATYFPIDLQITLAIQQITNPFFSQLMVFISYPGFAPQSYILVGIVCGILFFLGLRREAMVALLDAVSISYIGTFLKMLVGRPRPSLRLVHIVKYLGGNSFPSGHVLFYIAFFGFMWFLCYSLLSPSWYKKLVLGFLSLLIILIGPSRIYLGQHWASDVIGGYLFGSVWLLFIIYVYQKYDKKKNKDR